jgi:tetratricopeptide (TPR) repeat protein
LTGDTDLDIWARGIPEGLITNLENTGYFRVTTWERMRDILKQMGKRDVDQIDSDLGFEICRRAGIESLVTGTMRKAGDLFALDVRVLDAETKELRRSAASRGEGEESILSAQLDELSRAIVEGLGAPGDEVGSAQFQAAEFRTSSKEALDLYIIGTERRDNLDVEKAAEYLERAVNIDPSFAIAHHELGMVYLTIGKTVAARQAYARAMQFAGRASEKDRRTIEASYAQFIERDMKKAVMIREELVERYPDDKRMRFWLGFIYYQQGPVANAVREWKKCLKLDPDFGLAANHLGLAFSDLGEFEKALDTTKRYMAIAPGEADPWFNLGSIYVSMGKVAEAITAFQDSLRRQPDYYPSFSGLSYLLAFGERYPEALGTIERYLTLNLSAERRAQSLLWKGFYLHWLGRFHQALEALQQAQEAGRTVDHRNKGTIFYLMFKIHFDKGDVELGRKCAINYTDYQEKTRPNARNVVIPVERLFLLGLCDLKAGRVEDARSKLGQIKTFLQDVSPGLKETLADNISILETEINLAEGAAEKTLAYLEQDDSFVRGRTSFGNLITGFSLYAVINGNWPEFREALARAYADKGDFDRAIAEYERLISPDPKMTSSLIHRRFYYSLAKLYEQQGQKGKAKAPYERFLGLWKDADPGTPEVEDARARLVALR